MSALFLDSELSSCFSDDMCYSHICAYINKQVINSKKSILCNVCICTYFEVHHQILNE